MEITDVRIRLEHPTEKIKATVAVTFDDEFVVHDIKVFEGVNGLVIAMPSRRRSNGSYKDIAHPTNPETRTKIQNAIFEVYDQMILEDESAQAKVYESSIDSIEESA